MEGPPDDADPRRCVVADRPRGAGGRPHDLAIVVYSLRAYWPAAFMRVPEPGALWDLVQQSPEDTKEDIFHQLVQAYQTNETVIARKVRFIRIALGGVLLFAVELLVWALWP